MEPTIAAARRVFIKTYGCQMNVYDSQRMAEMLAAEGFEEAAGPETPTSSSSTPAISARRRPKRSIPRSASSGVLKDPSAKGRGKTLRIAVAGCVAQAEGEEMVRRAPAVDLVFGPQTYHRLGQFMARLEAGERQLVETALPTRSQVRPSAPRPRRSPGRARGVTAFVTIQEGCDKFCTFCVVPYTRGAEFSRPVAGSRRGPPAGDRAACAR
jgi:tRNA-2-methylthio-N6-dimethylallyladenosine synthase